MIPLNAASLNQATLPWRVTVLDETGSTSDWLKARAAEVPVGTVVFTELQTAGRGRRDNRWIAPRGKDLMFSLLLKPAAPLEKWPRITTLSALAICKGIEEELPLRPQIKWPNDIYLSDRKVSGLLAETVVSPQGMLLVLGIGINVNCAAFPPEITATSLLREVRPATAVGELDRNALAARLLAALHAEFQRLDDDFSAAITEVRERSWLLGRQIRAQAAHGEVFGRVLDLTEEGHLVLEFPGGGTHIIGSADEVREVRASWQHDLRAPVSRL